MDTEMKAFFSLVTKQYLLMVIIEKLNPTDKVEVKAAVLQVKADDKCCDTISKQSNYP